MADHLEAALKVVDSVLAPPRYDGELSYPDFQGKRAQRSLADAHSILNDGIQTRPDDARTHFCLALVCKYLETHQFQFWEHMVAANTCDPTFLEATIALRDRGSHLDPFCFPRWQDLRDGRATFRPSIIEDDTPKSCRVDLIRDGWRTIPVIVAKYALSCFRTKLANTTPALVKMNVDAVPPGLPALVQFVAVVFDDCDDPFFTYFYMNAFRVQDELYGVKVRHPLDYQPWYGRDTARRLCQEPCKCALFILDPDNRMLMARLIGFTPVESKRLQDLDRVLRLLPDQPVDIAVWAAAKELHNRYFCMKTHDPNGRTLMVPKQRSKSQTAALIRPLLDEDQLVVDDADESVGP